MTDREKREKVITALECYTTNAPLQEQERENCDLCDSCDYYVAPDGLSYCDVLTMLEDALALLKEQMPRVITLEEWDKWRRIPNGKRDPLYVQHSTGGWWILNYSNWMEIAFLTGEIRIWSSRPIDEQREATPWIE